MGKGTGKVPEPGHTLADQSAVVKLLRHGTSSNSLLRMNGEKTEGDLG